MGKSSIHTYNAPAAIGAYAQGVRVENLLYTAGQVGLDPKTGVLAGDDVAAQATQVLKNLGAILEAAEATFADVVKSTIYLIDIADFPVVNEIYGSHFGDNPPARSTVQVAGLPLGAKIEIDMVAYVGETNVPK
jgi:2-iminobutanoate/2-iminopropanoate deaminase